MYPKMSEFVQTTACDQRPVAELPPAEGSVLERLDALRRSQSALDKTVDVLIERLSAVLDPEVPVIEAPAYPAFLGQTCRVSAEIHDAACMADHINIELQTLLARVRI